MGNREQRSLQRLDQDLHRPPTLRIYLDRLTFGGNIIETGIDSYRIAHTLRNRDSTVK